MSQRHSRHKANPADCLRFCVEERLRCGASGGVRYTRRPEHHLPLPVALHAATNTQQLAEYEQRRAQAEASGQRL